MSFINTGQYSFRFCQRFTAIFLILCLAPFNTVSYAASVPAESIDTSAIKPLNLSELSIPEDLGKIEVSFAGSSGKTVVLIQDAHEIPDAQKNIQRLIDYFQKNYGVNLVALEGANAPLDPRIFKSFPDKETLKKVFKEYQERGELAAGAGAAIFGRDGGDYEGVEDWPLYEEGVGLYLQAMKKEPEVLEKIKIWEEKLAEEKGKVYSPELLELEKTLENFYRNHGTMLETLKKLAGVKPPAEGSELALILKESQAQASEETLELEVKKVALKIEAFLKSKAADEAGKKRLAEFNSRYQDFRTSRMPAKAFALFLKKMTARDRLPFKISRLLSSSMKDQRRMEEIKGTKFFEDFEHYADEVRDSIIRNEEERKLGKESRDLRLVERLAKLELSREDWNEIKTIDHRQQTTDNSKKNVSFRTPEGGEKSQNSEISQSPPAELLRNDMPFHTAFYENSEKRDAAFMKNLDILMRKKQASSAVLVAGGFHAEGLTRRLQDQGISYLRLMPNIQSIPEDTHYRDHMLGEVSWKKYLKAENGRINLYNAFVRGARDKLLAGNVISRSSEGATRNPGDFSLPSDQGRLLKSWRDQIIIDLANQNQVEKAGRYTQLIDEAAGIAPDSHEKIRTEWMANIERFAEGLRALQSRGELTRDNLLNLLKPATITTAPVSSGAQAVPGTAVAGDFFTRARGEWRESAASGLAEAPRSEIRAQAPRSKMPRDVRNELAAIKSSDLAEIPDTDHLRALIRDLAGDFLREKNSTRPEVILFVDLVNVLIVGTPEAKEAAAQFIREAGETLQKWRMVDEDKGRVIVNADKALQDLDRIKGLLPGPFPKLRSGITSALKLPAGEEYISSWHSSIISSAVREVNEILERIYPDPVVRSKVLVPKKAPLFDLKAMTGVKPVVKGVPIEGRIEPSGPKSEIPAPRSETRLPTNTLEQTVRMNEAIGILSILFDQGLNNADWHLNFTTKQLEEARSKALELRNSVNPGLPVDAAQNSRWAELSSRVQRKGFELETNQINAIPLNEVQQKAKMAEAIGVLQDLVYAGLDRADLKASQLQDALDRAMEIRNRVNSILPIDSVQNSQWGDLLNLVKRAWFTLAKSESTNAGPAEGVHPLPAWMVEQMQQQQPVTPVAERGAQLSPKLARQSQIKQGEYQAVRAKIVESIADRAGQTVVSAEEGVRNREAVLVNLQDKDIVEVKSADPSVVRPLKYQYDQEGRQLLMLDENGEPTAIVYSVAQPIGVDEKGEMQYIPAPSRAALDALDGEVSVNGKIVIRSEARTIGKVFGHQDGEAQEIKSSFESILDEQLGISVADRSKQNIHVLDGGADNGAFLKAFLDQLQAAGYSSVSGVGIEISKENVAKAVPGVSILEGDITKLGEEHPEMAPGSYEVITLMAPKWIGEKAFHPWLEAALRYLKDDGIILIRLYEPPPNANEADQLQMGREAAFLQKDLKGMEKDQKLIYRELTRAASPNLPVGNFNLGPLILVRKASSPFKGELAARSETRSEKLKSKEKIAAAAAKETLADTQTPNDRIVLRLLLTKPQKDQSVRKIAANILEYLDGKTVMIGGKKGTIRMADPGKFLDIIKKTAENSEARKKALEGILRHLKEKKQKVIAKENMALAKKPAPVTLKPTASAKPRAKQLVAGKVAGLKGTVRLNSETTIKRGLSAIERRYSRMMKDLNRAEKEINNLKDDEDGAKKIQAWRTFAETALAGKNKQMPLKTFMSALKEYFALEVDPKARREALFYLVEINHKLVDLRGKAKLTNDKSPLGEKMRKQILRTMALVEEGLKEPAIDKSKLIQQALETKDAFEAAVNKYAKNTSWRAWWDYIGNFLILGWFNIGYALGTVNKINKTYANQKSKLDEPERVAKAWKNPEKMGETLDDLWVLRETDRYVRSGFLPKLEALYAAIRRVSYAEEASKSSTEGWWLPDEEETSRSEARLEETDTRRSELRQMMPKPNGRTLDVQAVQGKFKELFDGLNLKRNSPDSEPVIKAYKRALQNLESLEHEPELRKKMIEAIDMLVSRVLAGESAEKDPAISDSLGSYQELRLKNFGALVNLFKAGSPARNMRLEAVLDAILEMATASLKRETPMVWVRAVIQGRIQFGLKLEGDASTPDGKYRALFQRLNQSLDQTNLTEARARDFFKMYRALANAKPGNGQSKTDARLALFENYLNRYFPPKPATPPPPPEEAAIPASPAQVLPTAVPPIQQAAETLEPLPEDEISKVPDNKLIIQSKGRMVQISRDEFEEGVAAGVLQGTKITDVEGKVAYEVTFAKGKTMVDLRPQIGTEVKMTEKVVSEVSAMFAPGNVRSELRLSAADPEKLADQMITVTSSDPEEINKFIEALKRKAEEWINAIGATPGTDKFVALETVKAELKRWFALLEGKDKALTLAVTISKQNSDLDIKNITDALIASQEGIGQVLITAEDGNVSHAMTAELKKNGIFFSVLKNLKRFNEATLTGQKMLPVVSIDEKIGGFENPVLFGVHAADKKADESDPLLEEAATKLEFVAAQLLANAIEDPNQLLNAAKIKDLNKQIAWKLFNIEGSGIVAIANGAVSVSRSELRSYLLAAQASEAVRKAA